MDLIEEYFKRDLTEEEEELLSRTLASSQEKAEFFAQKMSEFYQRDLGLEAPTWPGAPFVPPTRPTRWVLWILLLLFLAGVSLLYLKSRPVLDPTATIPEGKPMETRSTPAKPEPRGSLKGVNSVGGAQVKEGSSGSERTPVPSQEVPAASQPITARVQVLDAQGNLVQDLPGIPVPVLTQPTP